jgi:hypothetical protein
VATAGAVEALLTREAARPGAAWVSIDSAQGTELEGCEVGFSFIFCFFFLLFIPLLFVFRFFWSVCE